EPPVEGRWWSTDPRDFEVGRAILAAEPTIQTSAVCAALAALGREFRRSDDTGGGVDWRTCHRLDGLLGALFRRPLPFAESDFEAALREVVATLEYVSALRLTGSLVYVPMLGIVKPLERHVAVRGLPPALRPWLERLASALGQFNLHAEYAK